MGLCWLVSIVSGMLVTGSMTRGRSERGRALVIKSLWAVAVNGIFILLQWLSGVSLLLEGIIPPPSFNPPF